MMTKSRGSRWYSSMPSVSREMWIFRKREDNDLELTKMNKSSLTNISGF